MAIKIAELTAESGKSGAVFMETGFGAAGYSWSPTGIAKDAVPLDTAELYAADVAGHLRWEKERTSLTVKGRRNQMPRIVLGMVDRLGLSQQVKMRWTVDPASQAIVSIVYVACFLLGGIGLMAAAGGVVTLLSRGFYTSLLELTSTGALQLRRDYGEELERMRGKTLVNGIVLIAVGLLFFCALFALVFGGAMQEAGL